MVPNAVPMKPTLLILTNDVPKTDVSTHLIKLAVGVEDFAHLVRLQSARTGHNAAAEPGPYPRHITRQRPRREADLLSGGSMYCGSLRASFARANAFSRWRTSLMRMA